MALNLLAVREPPAAQILLVLAETFLDRTRGVAPASRPLPALPDCTFALLRDPYRFVERSCARLGRDGFQSRVFLRRTYFLRGQDAAELVYNGELFQRAGAVPWRLQRLLFGRGGVQGLDGEVHRRRKALFMGVLGSPQRVRALARLLDGRLQAALDEWQARGDVDWYGELRMLLTQVACDWAGVPLAEDELPERTAQLSALFEQARLFGTPQWRRWLQRKLAERWGAELVEAVREERLAVPDGSALQAVSLHRQADGSLLDAHVAAVELLNFLRPVVAVSVYGVFIAIALERWPECRRRLQEDEPPFRQAFVQEVRRYFPFFPMVVARSRRGVDWKGARIPAGARVMLDLYATNHDPALWEQPDRFDPERFFRQEAGAYTLVPQGGGDARMHHRCPGESLTLELMQVMADCLAKDLRYTLAPQDVRLDWQLLPPLARPACLLQDVQRTQQAALEPAAVSGERPALPH